MTNMSKNDPTEQRATQGLTQRAKRFRWSIAAGMGLGLLTGILLGASLAESVFEAGKRAGGQAARTGELVIPHTIFGDIFSTAIDSRLAVIIAALWSVGLLLTYFLYMRHTDEHDVHANLWGGSNGFYAMMTLAPAWHVLWMAQLVPPANLWAVLAASCLVGVATWAWLKFR